MSEQAGDTKLEVKQASKEVKESENVAEKYSAMTVSKNTEMNMGDLASSFSAVPTHKPVKKVHSSLITHHMCRTFNSVKPGQSLWLMVVRLGCGETQIGCISLISWPHWLVISCFAT